MNLQALKRDALEQLYGTVQTRLGDYRAARSIPLTAEQVLATPFVVADAPPDLITRGADADFESAKLLYGWMTIAADEDAAVSHAFPTDRDARDDRIWTWLTHAVFPAYCRERWPLPSNDEKATTSIRDHWFLTGQGQGAVGRHALARLWWGAHATFNAGARFHLPQLVAEPWAYTKVLLGVQNVNLQIRDRAFSGNPRVLLAALETLRRFGAQKGSINDASAWLGRELNVVARYRSLDILPFEDLLELCASLMRLGGAPSAPISTPGTRA